MKQPPSDNLLDLLASRRTVHEFTSEKVPDALINQALAAACWAPNHHLTEPWQFYLPGPETKDQICELNASIVAAKHSAEAAKLKLARWQQLPDCLVITASRAPEEELARENYAACCCAAQNMMLFLWSQGIGVKWSTGDITRDDRFYDLLWIDIAAEHVIGLFWYGYPAVIPPGQRQKTPAACSVRLA